MSRLRFDDGLNTIAPAGDRRVHGDRRAHSYSWADSISRGDTLTQTSLLVMLGDGSAVVRVRGRERHARKQRMGAAA